MIEHKLSNILLKPAEHLAGHDELYAFSASPLAFDEEGALRLTEPTDFMTFLNALSANKWRTYASIDEVTLHLELSGDACEVIVKGMPEGAKAEVQNTVELSRVSVEPVPGEHAQVSARIDTRGMDLVAFELLPSGTTLLHGGHWSAEVEESRVRPVRLAVSTTTFKKEHYKEIEVASVDAFQGREKDFIILSLLF